MKIILVGNCQVEHLADYMRLAITDESIDVLAAKPVYLIEENEVEVLHEMIKRCDLLICQPIGDEYRANIGLGTKYLKSLLGKYARSIVIPNLYYDASFPSFGYFKNNINGEAIRASDEMWSQNLPWGDYHDFLLFASVLKGLNANDYLELVNKHPTWDIEAIRDASILQMSQRDLACDIKGAEIFDCLEPTELASAFHSYNHPSNKIMNLLSMKILEIASIDYISTEIGEEKLVHPKLPIYRVTAGDSYFSGNSLEVSFEIYKKEYFHNLDKIVTNTVCQKFHDVSKILMANL